MLLYCENLERCQTNRGDGAKRVSEKSSWRKKLASLEEKGRERKFQVGGACTKAQRQGKGTTSSLVGGVWAGGNAKR